ILAEVHDPAHGRDGRRGNLHEVEPLAPRQLQGLRRRHDAELCAGFVDDTNFAHPDAFVRPDAVVSSWAAIVSDNYLRESEGPAPCSAVCRPRAATSSSAARRNSATGRAPRSPPVRLRTETVPSAASRSPTTSM